MKCAENLTLRHSISQVLEGSMCAVAGAGEDFCEALVTVKKISPPTPICNPFVTLPATTNCAAQITDAALKTAITATVINNGGDVESTMLAPFSPTGTYNLPVGTYDFTLKVIEAWLATCPYSRKFLCAKSEHPKRCQLCMLHGVDIAVDQSLCRTFARPPGC